MSIPKCFFEVSILSVIVAFVASVSGASELDSRRVGVEKSDVVIVGSGISGLTAALELGRGGAKVTVIDMSSVFGGHAVMSQGGVSVINTPIQKAAGIKDSPELAYRDFMKWGEDANADWVRYYVDHSRRDIYDWLNELGVKFDKEVGTAPGNSVDRFHQPTGRGIGLVTPIYRECLAYDNIRFVWEFSGGQTVDSERTSCWRLVSRYTNGNRTRVARQRSDSGDRRFSKQPRHGP